MSCSVCWQIYIIAWLNTFVSKPPLKDYLRGKFKLDTMVAIITKLQCINVVK